MAFSCCLYDGGRAEKLVMDSLREKWWKGKFKKKDRLILPGVNRIDGKCPMTPLEVFLNCFYTLYFAFWTHYKEYLSKLLR